MLEQIQHLDPHIVVDSILADLERSRSAAGRSPLHSPGNFGPGRWILMLGVAF